MPNPNKVAYDITITFDVSPALNALITNILEFIGGGDPHLQTEVDALQQRLKKSNDALKQAGIDAGV